MGVREVEVTAKGLLLVSMFAALSASAETRRVAIVVGNNAGNGSLAPLRYAENDAGKFARVLVELGDVGPDDVLLLQGRRVADLERAIADAKERVTGFKRVPDTRAVLIFYFSGHSDGEALELGGENLPYARLKAMLLGTGADLRVAIVDACKSGAGFREKGGRPAEPFVIKLSDTLVASGDAFIMSSAADESALESSEVMGSYFTHNFISGLRGAADSSGDKLVTLAEAYHFAYDRTVSATSVLPVGVQHPSYDFRLSGQGELVLASLVKPSATLVVPEGSERSLVTDVIRDQVIVELPPGPIREVALSPGQYGLRLMKGGQSFGGRITLSEGNRRIVKWDELTLQTSGVAVARKGPDGELSQQVPDAKKTVGDPAVISVGIGMSRDLADLLVAQPVGLSAVLRVGFEPTAGDGLTFSLWGQLPAMIGGRDFASGGLQVGGIMGRIGYRWAWTLNRFWFGAGPEAGGGVFLERGNLENAVGMRELRTEAAACPVLALRGTARLKLFSVVSMALDLDFAAGALMVNGALQFLPLPTGTLGLAVDL
ncbi:MAG: caspase family protein [Myxococcaceae bacterium]|nr:caspase family protein [Myxococcaceae bacterium]